MKYNIFFIFLFLIISCSSDEVTEEEYIELSYETDEENLVSHLSIEAFTADKAFGRGISELSDLELSFFGVGNAMFDQSWVSSPATTTSRDGLGPIFNARACSACHLRDGRGKPLLASGDGSEGFLLRLSSGNDLTYGPIAFAGYGGQLQDDSNNGVLNEGEINVSFEIITGEYPDGTPYELRKPNYSINGNYGDLSTAFVSPRVGQQVIGLGFIDALSEASILANGDMGLTTTTFPDENCPDGIDCSTYSNGINEGETVEVTDTQMSRMMTYMGAISVPIRRDFKTYDVLKGKELFNEMDCIKCHVNNFTTTKFELLPQIENVVIRPYSDFLLHDMGDDLADNSPDFLATGNEWRTQPLWGLGMIDFVNDHTFLLHDGRARNIEEAILWHGGEALSSKDNFMNATAEERAQVLSFLNSL